MDVIVTAQEIKNSKTIHPIFFELSRILLTEEDRDVMTANFMIMTAESVHRADDDAIHVLHNLRDINNSVLAGQNTPANLYMRVIENIMTNAFRHDLGSHLIVTSMPDGVHNVSCAAIEKT